MVNCGTCNRQITGKQLKINCAECQSNFHANCVNLSKADIDYLTSESSVWRCEPCSVNRRKSLMLETEATEGTITLNDLMKAINELTREHKQSIRDFNTSYEVMNEKLDENTKTLKDQTEKIKEYLQIIETLKDENKQLKERLDVMETKLDEAEQYSRRNCVEIQGVPVAENDVIGTVRRVGKAIGMNITDEMIDTCHTLRKRPNTEGPPGIIVKFVRRIDADDMLAKKRGKKDLSTRHLDLQTDKPIYINESLTPLKRRLMGMAREVRRSNNYKWLWVRAGKIFMKKEDNSPVILIKCQADLNKLVM